MQYIPKGEFSEQARVLKAIVLIKELSVRQMSVRQIAELLDCSERTVYRFFVTFRDADIKIFKERNKFYIQL